jgi:hypothetical protein
MGAPARPKSRLLQCYGFVINIDQPRECGTHACSYRFLQSPHDEEQRAPERGDCVGAWRQGIHEAEEFASDEQVVAAPST